LVLSDQYFPGWKAFIDGKETPIYQVNGLLRGITTPKGLHTVEFIYRPTKIYLAAVIGFVSLLGVIIVATLKSQKKRG
ncbi:MAG: YfhO family protein, partial [Candidatus Methanomethylicaceae archaeon]